MRVDHLLRQSIMVRPYSGVNGFGEPAYGAQVTRAARVEWTDAVAPDGDGEQSTKTATIITLAAIGPEDRVWLPRPGASSVTTADAADNTKARTPGPEGCSPAIGHSGTTDYFVTRL